MMKDDIRKRCSRPTLPRIAAHNKESTCPRVSIPEKSDPFDEREACQISNYHPNDEREIDRAHSSMAGADSSAKEHAFISERSTQTKR